MSNKKRNSFREKGERKQKIIRNQKSELKNIPQRCLKRKYTLKPKLSEIVLKYAEPLLREVSKEEGKKKAIGFSVLFWNASLLPKDEALKLIEPGLSDMAKGDNHFKKDFYAIFEMMYIRKQKYFKNDKRFIFDYSVEENSDGLFLQVASTTPKT